MHHPWTRDARACTSHVPRVGRLSWAGLDMNNGPVSGRQGYKFTNIRNARDYSFLYQRGEEKLAFWSQGEMIRFGRGHCYERR